VISPLHTVGAEAGCCKLLFDEVSDCDSMTGLHLTNTGKCICLSERCVLSPLHVFVNST